MREPILVVESVWMHEKPDWTEFYVVCKEEIFQIKPFVLPGIRQLPPEAEEIMIASRKRSRGQAATYDHPTAKTLGEVSFIGTELGDDVTFLLANGSGIIYYLECDPSTSTIANPGSEPRVLFLEPEDFLTLDVTRDRDKLEPVELSPVPG